MTSKKLTGIEKLENLADVLVEDILNMSNEELITQAKEQFDDPKAEADHIRDLFSKAMLQTSKDKLAKAQAAVSVHKSKGNTVTVIQLSSAQKKTVIDRFVGNDQQLQQKLTMAARNGKGIQTENDIDSLVEDLIELEIIDEKGLTK